MTTQQIQTQVTFRHMKVSEPIRQYAADRIQKLDKFVGDTSEAHVVLSVEKHQHQAHFELIISGNQRARADEKSGDMYQSIDTAIEKLVTQVKRYRSKARKSHRGEDNRLKALQVPYQILHLPKTGDLDEAEYESHQVVRQESMTAEEMNVNDALVQMDMLNSDFLVFTNANSQQVNVLYRLPDGQYGLIEARAPTP